MRVSATSAGAEGVPISSGVTAHNMRFGCVWLLLYITELGEWKRNSVLADTDSVCKTSSMPIKAFDINLYFVGVGDFKFASNIELVISSGAKGFLKI